MSIAAAPLALIGGGLQLGGQFMNMRANQQAATYQGMVARRNAALAEENALRELEAGQTEGQDWGQDAAAAISDRIAALGASGTLANVGSNAETIAAGRRLAMRDQTRMRRQTETAARGYRQQRADFLSEARMSKLRHRNAFWSGMLGMGSSLIGGAQGYREAGGTWPS